MLLIYKSKDPGGNIPSEIRGKKMNFLNLNIPGLTKGKNKYDNERYFFQQEEIYMLSCMSIDGTNFLTIKFHTYQKETASRLIEKFGFDDFKPDHAGGMSAGIHLPGKNSSFTLEITVSSLVVKALKKDGNLASVTDNGKKTLELI